MQHPSYSGTGVSASLRCLSQAEITHFSEEISNIISDCHHSRLCVLSDKHGKSLARHVCARESTMALVKSVTGARQITLVRAGLSVRLPEWKRKTLVHRDGLQEHYTDSLVCFYIALTPMSPACGSLVFFPTWNNEFLQGTHNTLRYPDNTDSDKRGATKQHFIQLAAGNGVIYKGSVPHGRTVERCGQSLGILGFYICSI